MKIFGKISILMTVTLALAFNAFAAERLAIAEPVNKGGLKNEDVEALWGMLEASVDGGYELISRAALKSMLTEIGLVESSGLVQLNSHQKARLGELKAVRFLLVPTVAKFGSKMNLSLMVIDASTGEIDTRKSISETFGSLDELADKLPDMLNEIALGGAPRQRGKSAMIAPVIRVPGAPAYLAGDFNVRLEEALLQNGIRLQNLQSVTKILAKNHIDNLYEVEPAMFVKIGNLLRVDRLLQATVSRFSCTFKKEYIAVTRTTVTRCIGNIEGDIRIISAPTGELTAAIPFKQKVDFDDLEDTEDWTEADYGKYLLEKALPGIAAAVTAKLK